MKSKDSASKKILIALKFEKDLETSCKVAYPDLDFKNCRKRVLDHLKSMNTILRKRHPLTLTRKGKAEHDKLLRNFIVYGEPYWKSLRKLPNPSLVDEKAFKFYSEIDDALQELELMQNDISLNEKEVRKKIASIVAEYSKAAGSQITVLSGDFLDKWREMEKRWVDEFKKTGRSVYVMKSKKILYEVDRDKLFDLYTAVNKIPKSIETAIKTSKPFGVFKNFLVGWLLNDIRDKQFTRKNIMPVIEETLHNTRFRNAIKESGEYPQFDSQFPLFHEELASFGSL